MKLLAPITAAALMLASPAFSGACDYAPSNLIGESGSTAAAGTAGTAAAVGSAAKFGAGAYAVTTGTGTAMLGSTMAGSSAAGTIGFVSGSAGVVGTVGAVLLSPFVIIGGAVLAVGIVGMEIACD